MNIAEILKNCPKGLKLYSSIHGEVELVCTNEYSDRYPIYCKAKNGKDVTFTSDGRILLEYPDAECVLFPSKDQRDWSKFGVSDQTTDQKQETKLKPFDKVLVRNNDDDEWVCDIFSHIDELAFYYCVGTRWEQCIPYESNEHLLGTTNKQQ
jgi:hypothetical protein|nr:MAG TPA: hypothetical protein [Caudoviricetes sp.]